MHKLLGSIPSTKKKRKEKKTPFYVKQKNSKFTLLDVIKKGLTCIWKYTSVIFKMGFLGKCKQLQYDSKS
jgi:hypothetical protein